jgi:hypothetical protein
MHTANRGIIFALWIATAAAAFGIGWITPPPHVSPPVPDDLAAAIRSALGEGDALERLARTTTLLEDLEPENLPAVVTVYERMITSIDPADLRAFFSAWARFDPAGALEYALAWPRRNMLEERRIGVRAAIAGWAYANPSEARVAAEEVAKKNAPLRGDVWISLVAGWLRSDQGTEGFGTFLTELRPRQQRDAAADIAARELVRIGGADAALDWADAIVGDESQEPAFKRAVFEGTLHAAVVADPARTGAWALEHAEADYAVDTLLIAAGRWGRADGAAAMEWLGAYPAGEPRDKAVREAFLAWTTADWVSALGWLESISQTPFHDPALEVWAEQLLAWEPAEALGWCERILDVERRQRCLASGASRWYATDALAAEAWLQTSSLDEELRSQVRNKAGKSRPRRPRRPRAGSGAT